MIAGVLLGPAVFNVVHATDPLRGISDLAVFLMVLAAGLEMNSKDVLRAMSGKGLLVALPGFTLPPAAGILMRRSRFIFSNPGDGFLSVAPSINRVEGLRMAAGAPAQPHASGWLAKRREQGRERLLSRADGAGGERRQARAPGMERFTATS